MLSLDCQGHHLKKIPIGSNAEIPVSPILQTISRIKREIDHGEKADAETRLLEIREDTQADLVVLARCIQILSDTLCSRLEGKIINIHHSFLPGFKGARPYHKAHQHGVKLIGATAHYVSPELDEGPIIEQLVERVDHSHTTEDLVAVGRDVESMTLARAVKLHVEHRVLLNGRKTVVLR